MIKSPKGGKGDIEVSEVLSSSEDGQEENPRQRKGGKNEDYETARTDRPLKKEELKGMDDMEFEADFKKTGGIKAVGGDLGDDEDIHFSF